MAASPLVTAVSSTEAVNSNSEVPGALLLSGLETIVGLLASKKLIVRFGRSGTITSQHRNKSPVDVSLSSVFGQPSVAGSSESPVSASLILHDNLLYIRGFQDGTILLNSFASAFLPVQRAAHRGDVTALYRLLLL